MGASFRQMWFFFLMIRRPPRSTLDRSSAASDVYKRQPLNTSGIKKIAILGPQADQVELGDYSGPIEGRYRITPLAGIKKYIEQNKLNIEVVSKAGGNTARRTDFFNMVKFSTVTKAGAAKEFDATKFDASSNGLITSARFGSASVRGIKDGDWTAYNNVDITDVDSIRFNMTVSGDGGTIEVRVGSPTGNILSSTRLAAPQQSGGGEFFPRPQNYSAKLNTLDIAGAQTI